MRERLRHFVEDTLWPELEEPLTVIIVHVAVSCLSVLSIAFIKLVLYIAGLDGKVIPGTGPVLHWLGFNTEVTLSDWMFVLELGGATIIIMMGIYRAITGRWRP
jgi:hypothetical protein